MEHLYRGVSGRRVRGESKNLQSSIPVWITSTNLASEGSSRWDGGRVCRLDTPPAGSSPVILATPFTFLPTTSVAQRITCKCTHYQANDTCCNRAIIRRLTVPAAKVPKECAMMWMLSGEKVAGYKYCNPLIICTICCPTMRMELKRESDYSADE